jgi:DNA (cytosine-5)-methyltransferase 1
MKYLSVCSGIEAATVAWHPLGWTPVAFSEIEKFPSEVLKHHYPQVPNVGDMTKFKEWNLDSNVDVFVGGTPCQSFSVAGLRKGLDDPRGNLMLTYLAIADKYRPKWLVWENVAGVLSSNGGKDFGTFLGGLGELGYGFAYRILDAQYFGVAQRRRRVFVVGCLGDWRSAAAVLFERHSLSGHPAPRREKRQGFTASIGDSTQGSYDCGVELCPTLSARDYKDAGTDGINKNSAKMIPVFSLQGSGVTSQSSNGDGWNEDVSFTLNRLDVHGIAQPISFDMAQITSKVNGTRVEPNLPVSTLAKGSQMHVAMSVYENHPADSRVQEMGETCSTVTSRWGTGGGNTPMVTQPITFSSVLSTQYVSENSETSQTLESKNQMAICLMDQGGSVMNIENNITGTLRRETHGHEPVIMQQMAVRRLTPVECERLQGFPDNYTDIKLKGKATPDGSRYKALGNSMAVPVMAWIGKRIQEVENIKCKPNK